MEFLMGQPLSFCLFHYCIRHGMREMLFQTGCKTKHVGFFVLSKGNDLCYPGTSMCKGTCFIENNGICRSYRLQEFPPLTVTCAFPASRIAESTAKGIANFSAQEKSTIRTDKARATLRVNAKLNKLPTKV